MTSMASKTTITMKMLLVMVHIAYLYMAVALFRDAVGFLACTLFDSALTS